MKAGPIALEAIDNTLVANMKKEKVHLLDLELLPKGKGWLVAEFGGGTKEESDAPARALMAKLKLLLNAPSMKLYDDEKEEKESVGSS